MVNVEVLHLIKGANDVVSVIECKVDGKTRFLNPKTFEARYGDYKDYMKGNKND